MKRVNMPINRMDKAINLFIHTCQNGKGNPCCDVIGQNSHPTEMLTVDWLTEDQLIVVYKADEDWSQI